MKVTTKGQVTIPLRIRNFLNIEPHAEVEFTIQGGSVVLTKTESEKKTSTFQSLRGSHKGKLTTREWMKATRS